ncbi:uncharacterized protein TNCV_896241 [Trichonephila clavipes]|nr:uncharacterized protein TNCV_896241 [Trichonephila clavipes]
MDQWAPVLITDMSRFILTRDSRRTFIWRESGTCYRPLMSKKSPLRQWRLNSLGRQHKAHLIDEFLESEDIRGRNWSLRSTDLIPVERVWNALRRIIATRNLRGPFNA